MAKKIKVDFRGIETLEFEEGTTYEEIAKVFQRYFNYPILVAKVDNQLKGLKETLAHKCSIDFYDRSSIVGNSTYGSSVQMLLIVAIKKLFGEKSEIRIENSLGDGIYCEIENVELSKSVVAKIEAQMRELVEADLFFTKLSVLRFDAIKYFKKKGQLDKVKLLKYISNSNVNLFRLDEVYDYFFNELAPSTKVLDSFALTYIKGNGFILSYPSIYNPECTLDYVHKDKIYKEFIDYAEWGTSIGIENAADLNECVAEGKAGDIIRVAEAHYASQLTRIADEVYKKKDDVKIILIGGPSSSGKTTTAKKLAVYLEARGLRPHTLSIDDYFLEREETPKDENGNYDFESLRALDLELFNKQLFKLLEGAKVDIPTFNFLTGKKEFGKKFLQLKEKDVIVIEGLHAINDELTASIEMKNKYKIYIAPLTQINLDNHNRIHATDTRRLRRIIRDNRTRGYNAAQTLKMWASIREGEVKYIFPHQNNVDAIINTALVYEIGVLKTYVEPLLFSVKEDDPNYPEAIRLINFLRNFLPIPSEEVPLDSVLREFIGGSCFKY